MIRLITTLFIISSLITPVLLFGQKITQAQYELTESESFVRPINNWLFPTKKSIVAIEKSQITWLNDTGTEQFTLPENTLKIIFSKNNNYFGILSLTHVPESTNDSGIFRIEIYTADKEKLYEVQRNYYYDDSLPFVAISDFDGSLIIGQNTTGEIWFYNQNGSLLNKVELFKDAEYDLERTLYFDLSKDGTALAIVAGKRGASPAGSNAPHPSAEPHLFLFSLNGEELLRIPLPYFSISATAISDSGKYIAVSSYTVDINGNMTKRTIILDDTGKEIGQVNLLSKLAHFSSDSKFLVLADNRTAKAFDLTTKDISWSYNIRKTEGMIAAVDISNKGEIAEILVANSEFKDGTFIFTHPRLKILSHDGNLLQALEMTDKEFEKPALRLSDDSKKIFIGFRDAYQIYQVK